MSVQITSLPGAYVKVSDSGRAKVFKKESHYVDIIKNQVRIIRIDPDDTKQDLEVLSINYSDVTIPTSINEDNLFDILNSIPYFGTTVGSETQAQVTPLTLGLELNKGASIQEGDEGKFAVYNELTRSTAEIYTLGGTDNRGVAGPILIDTWQDVTLATYTINWDNVANPISQGNTIELPDFGFGLLFTNSPSTPFDIDISGGNLSTILNNVQQVVNDEFALNFSSFIQVTTVDGSDPNNAIIEFTCNIPNNSANSISISYEIGGALPVFFDNFNGFVPASILEIVSATEDSTPTLLYEYSDYNSFNDVINHINTSTDYNITSTGNENEYEITYRALIPTTGASVNYLNPGGLTSYQFEGVTFSYPNKYPLGKIVQIKESTVVIDNYSDIVEGTFSENVSVNRLVYVDEDALSFRDYINRIELLPSEVANSAVYFGSVKENAFTGETHTVSRS